MNPSTTFNEAWACEIFPPEKTDLFFEALFGDAEEGAYSISLRFIQGAENTYHFVFDLHQRSNKCLVCSLTYGLPQVFTRHPIINVKGMATSIAQALGKDPSTVQWRLEPTQEHSASHHSIPFIITFSA